MRHVLYTQKRNRGTCAEALAELAKLSKHGGGGATWDNHHVAMYYLLCRLVLSEEAPSRRMPPKAPIGALGTQRISPHEARHSKFE